jgi:hypothetical protein
MGAKSFSAHHFISQSRTYVVFERYKRARTKMAKATPDDNKLMPDRDVRAEFKVTAMTLWRWDHDPRMAELGWPQPVRICKRKYRSHRQIQAFKAALIAKSIAERAT